MSYEHNKAFVSPLQNPSCVKERHKITLTGFPGTTPAASNAFAASSAGLNAVGSLSWSKLAMGRLTEPGKCPWRKPGRGSGEAPLNRKGGRASKIVVVRDSPAVTAAKTCNSKSGLWHLEKSRD